MNAEEIRAIIVSFDEAVVVEDFAAMADIIESLKADKHITLAAKFEREIKRLRAGRHEFEE